jgi:hypothetical protein
MASDTWIKDWGKFLIGSSRILRKDVAVKTRPASSLTPTRTHVPKTIVDMRTGALHNMIMVYELE